MSFFSLSHARDMLIITSFTCQLFFAKYIFQEVFFYALNMPINQYSSASVDVTIFSAKSKKYS